MYSGIAGEDPRNTILGYISEEYWPEDIVVFGVYKEHAC